MSVTIEASQTTFVTNGVTTAFPTGWKFFEAATIRCRYTPTGGSETVLTLGVHYTVSGGSGSSGTVTTTPGHTLAAGTLIVERDVPLTQLVDFRTQGPFAAETHTEVADRAMMAIQQVERRLTVVEAGGGPDGGDFAARLSALEGSQATQDTTISGIADDVATVTAAESALEGVVAALDVPVLSAATPQPIGTAAAGSTGDASDAGHVHAHGDQAGGTLHAVATESANGFASKELVQQVNGLSAEKIIVVDAHTTDATPTQVTSYTPDVNTFERVIVEAVAVDASGAKVAVVLGSIGTPSPPYVLSTANGSQTQFTFPFWALLTGDIQVYVNDVQKTLGTDFSVTLPTGATLGKVTFVSAPANAAVVKIVHGGICSQVFLASRGAVSTTVQPLGQGTITPVPGLLASSDYGWSFRLDASSPQVRLQVHGSNEAVRWRITIRRLSVALA